MPASRSLRQRKREVPSDFDIVATTYDRLVRRNPGYVDHLLLGARRLAEAVVPAAVRVPGWSRGLRVLDLCCGTGLSTEAVTAAFPDADRRRARRVVGDARPGPCEGRAP